MMTFTENNSTGEHHAFKIHMKHAVCATVTTSNPWTGVPGDTFFALL